MLEKLDLKQTGTSYRDFLLTKALEIKEINCVLREFVHKPTGAKVMHIANDDPENVFCLSFKTLPETSNGVAHILEHTVLCGSKKFPIRDPFFSMMRRSLNTYMNALTGADFTCYPAATQIQSDFYHLLEVYLDAVFHPLLSKESFLQEGHRLELQDLDSLDSPLQYKGIVFNEMKGSLASPHRRLLEAVNQALYPDLTYGINSGGDPLEIPKLTYEELKSFHQQYYHPSRCLFYFYGNLPVEGHLDFIAEHALKDVSPQPPLPVVAKQTRFAKPTLKKLSFPSSDAEKEKHLVGLAWLTCPILQQEEVLALSIVDTILMDTDASLLKRELLKSSLATQMSAYLDSEISEIPYVLTFKGCQADQGERIYQKVLEILQDIVKKGIEPRLIESAIHQHQLNRLEITGDSFPYGLSLFMRCALLVQHDGAAEDGLKIFSLFAALKQKIKNEPRYLEQLIERYLIANPHVAIIEMAPSSKQAEVELAQEKEQLAKIETSLNVEMKQKIQKEAKALLELQEREEDLDILPKLALSDIPKKVKSYPLTTEQMGACQVFHHDCFTNDIAYVDIVLDLPPIEGEAIFLTRLLSVLFAQLGTAKRSYQENLEYMQAHTGGIGTSLALFIDATTPDLFVPAFQIHGKALKAKTSHLLQLMEEMFFSLDFSDFNRIKEVLSKQLTGLESSLNQSALKYASSLSASAIRPASWLSEKWYGLHYLNQLRALVRDFDQQKEKLSAQLKQLLKQINRPKRADLILSCDQESAALIKKENFLAHLNLDKTEGAESSLEKNSILYQGRIISSPVAFTSKVFPSLSYSHPDAPALALAAQLFENSTLHPKVREQGGAYGAGARCGLTSGLFHFYSYRDPNIFETVKAFQEAVEEVVDLKFGEEDLEQAKLEAIQSLDAPMSPGSRALTAYEWHRLGKSDPVRQKYRTKLLSLTPSDVQKAVSQHLAPQMKEGRVVSFASKELLEKENERFKQANLPTLALLSTEV